MTKRVDDQGPKMSAGSGDDSTTDSQATRLIQLVRSSGVELWHCAYGDAYIP